MHSYTFSSIYHIAKADFLQRVRSQYFLISLGACIFLIYSFVPMLDAGYTILSLGNYRGYYNSAWIGSMVANCVPFFALIGFYVVNYAVKRDIDTGVGQIIATTRVTRMQYLSGKFFSNFSILMLMLIIIAIMTIVMFLLRGETMEINIGNLLLPLLILTTPAMFILASLSLFFDSLTAFNRGLLNILYFFLWIFLVGVSNWSPFADIFGINTSMIEIKNSISTLHPDWNGESGLGLLLRDSQSGLKVFTWEGMHWTTSILLQRLFWIATALGLVLLSSQIFNRFDTVESKQNKPRKHFINKMASQKEYKYRLPGIKFREAILPEARFSFFTLIVAEIRIMVKGNSMLWLITTSTLFITTIFTSINFSSRVVLPLIWFFQTLILSKIGSREILHRCDAYIFSAPFPLWRQLPASLFAAFTFLILLSSPIVIRLFIHGNFYEIFAIITGALFIPVFAISLGIITGGSKFFEVIFTIMVYGNFNGVPFFDFTGGMEESQVMGIPYYLLAITFFLIIIAFIARERQITHA